MEWEEKAQKYIELSKNYQDTLNTLLCDEFCIYCNRPAESFDHVVARSRDGEDEPFNLEPVCRFCNTNKSDHSLLEWLELQEKRLSVLETFYEVPEEANVVKARITTLKYMLSISTDSRHKAIKPLEYMIPEIIAYIRGNPGANMQTMLDAVRRREMAKRTIEFMLENGTLQERLGKGRERKFYYYLDV